jgi:hypothetical protein
VVSGSVRLAVADFNADGNLDVATVNGGQKNFGVLLGKEDGSFENPVTYPVTRNAWAITAGDVDGNGTVDVVVGEEGPTGPSVQTFLGKGNGTFAAPISSPYTMTTPNDAELADFNGDGVLDVVFADLVANRVVYLPGLGNGTFGTSVVFPLTASTNSSVDRSVGDFNGDSRLDIVVANSAQNYFTLLTNRCAP